MDSETVQVLLQEVCMLMNPNLSLKLLIDGTFEEFFQMSSSYCCWSSLEHSTNAAKNGSFLKLLATFFLGENSSRKLVIFLDELFGTLFPFPHGGGINGRSWPRVVVVLFFLENICFGIPGIFSQEKGTPFGNWRGVVGLIGELWSSRISWKESDDPKEELEEWDGDEERDDGVLRRFVGGGGRKSGVENVVSWLWWSSTSFVGVGVGVGVVRVEAIDSWWREKMKSGRGRYVVA